MNWTQLLKNAVITAIGAPIVYWIIVEIFGGVEATTPRTYVVIAIASVIGGTIGEIWRQKTQKN